MHESMATTSIGVAVASAAATPARSRAKPRRELLSTQMYAFRTVAGLLTGAEARARGTLRYHQCTKACLGTSLGARDGR